MDFKIGDRVIVEKDNINFGRNGWTGTIVKGPWGETYKWEVVFDDGLKLWCDVKCLAEETKKQDKIVITTDGKTTTATLYREDGSKEVATAKCCPEDTFDFNVGAKLAMERLMKKVEPVTEWRVVNRKPRVGDYIRLTRVDYPTIDNLGDIRKVDGVKDDLVYVLEKNHPGFKPNNSNFEWNYSQREYEVVEKVTTTEPKKPEPPKYFTGRAVCVSMDDDDGMDTTFTVGKIYKIDNGKFIDNNGSIRPCSEDRVHTAKELEEKIGYWGWWAYKFIPIVE